MKTPLPKLRPLRSQPVRVDRRGLVVAGTVQMFPFEKRAQAAFALYVSRANRSVLNVGYGCGFAHAALVAKLGAKVILIEANSRIYRRAVQAHGDGAVIINSPWQVCLEQAAPREPFDIYFDAFPHFASFDFSPSAFRGYLSEFLEAAVRMQQLDTAYFIALDRSTIHFPVARGWRVRRVLSAPVPERYRTRAFSKISLYEVRRVKGRPRAK